MRAKKWLIHAFVLFHLAAAVVWAFTDSPPRTKLERAARGRFAFYMFPTGLWQAWDMFAPNPALANVYLETEVTFRDGSRTMWKVPRMEQLGYWERYRKERYRKWANERVASAGEGPGGALLCNAAARFAARQVERPDNPAVSPAMTRPAIFLPAASRHTVASSESGTASASARVVNRTSREKSPSQVRPVASVTRGGTGPAPTR